MMRLTIALSLLLFVAGCSSAAVPGADDALGQVDKAKRALVESTLRNVVVAEEAYFVEHQAYTTDLTALGIAPREDITVGVARADATSFCAEASDGVITVHQSKGDPTAQVGAC